MELSYNPKIDYLFSKYIYHKSFIVGDEQLWKDVYNGVKKPQQLEQVLMLNCKKIITFIKQKKTKFTMTNLLKCFSILTEHEENPSKLRKMDTIEKLVAVYEERQDEDIAAELFLTVLQEKIFPKKYNVEMAKIIHNFIQWKSGRLPAIIYAHQTKKIEKLLANEEFEGALLEMNNVYQRTKHFNRKHKLISLETLKSKILEIRDILNQRYGVIEFYVYGSYAIGSANEYSDLDVYIGIDDKAITGDLKFDVLLYLEEELGIEIDGKLSKITANGKGLEIDMIRHLIKIF